MVVFFFNQVYRPRKRKTSHKLVIASRCISVDLFQRYFC